MTNDLRLELRARNNVLWHAIFDRYPSVSAFCRAHGFFESTVGNLLNLKDSPYYTYKRTGPTKTAVRIAAAVGMCVEDLFPPALYACAFPPKMVAEVPSHLYRGLNAAKHVALPPAQDDEVVAREFREAVSAALVTLPPREAEILRDYYGLEGREEMTSREIATKQKISLSRLGQVRDKALLKLRHRSRSRKLAPFLKGE